MSGASTDRAADVALDTADAYMAGVLIYGDAIRAVAFNDTDPATALAGGEAMLGRS